MFTAARCLAAFAACSALCFGTAQSTRAQTPEKLSPKQIFQTYSDSVVKIVTDSGSGTGFFIKNGSMVATCFHVIKDASKIEIQGTKDKKWKATAVYFDKESDAALLKIEEDTGRKAIPIGDLAKLSTGDELCVIGNPLGFLDQSLTTGIVSARRTVGKNELIQTTAAISPGSSGGPVFNDLGQVVGFVDFFFTEGQSLNMAVSVASLVRLMGEDSIPIASFLTSAKTEKGGTKTEGTKRETPPVTGAASKEIVKANEMFGKWFGDLGREILKWDYWFVRELTKESEPNKSFYEKAESHAEKVRTEMKRYKDLADHMTDSRLWTTKELDAFFEALKELSNLTFDLTIAESNARVSMDKGEAKSKAAMETAVSLAGKVTLAFGKFYDIFEEMDWFDYEVFRTKVSPNVMYGFFVSSLSGIHSDPAHEEGCYVAWANSSLRLVEGDRIIAIKRKTDTTYTSTPNWLILQETLNDWEDETEVIVKYVTRGRESTATLKVKR